MDNSGIIHQGAVESSRILNKRFEENRLVWYKPCCKVHDIIEEIDGERVLVSSCPNKICPDSKHVGFHMSNKRVRIVLGGNRSGKSIVGLSELLMMATLKTHPFRKTKNPIRGRYRIYGPDYGIIEKMTLPLVKEWIPRKSLAGEGKTKEECFDNSYDSKYHILRLKEDVMIDFMSYDQDADKSESVSLDAVWADEEIPENLFSAVLSRLISRGGKFWMTVTPLYGITWAMRFIDGIDPNSETFNFDIKDNPYLSDKAIKDFEESLPEHEKDARLHGRFLELQGLVYKELRPDVHLIEACEPRVGDPVIFSLDPHPRKPSVMNWCFVNSKEEVVFFDELELSGTAEEIVRAIRYKESGHKSQTLLRVIDPAAKAQGNNLSFETDTLKEFEREGMGFSLADNSQAGYNVVKDYLKFDNKQPLGFFNRPMVYFSRTVPKTWYSLTHLMWDDWTNRNVLKDKKEKIKEYGKDFSDCVRYALALRPNYRTFANLKAVPLGNMALNKQNPILLRSRRPSENFYSGRRI